MRYFKMSMRYRINFKETTKDVLADVTVEGDNVADVERESREVFERAREYARMQTFKKMR